MIYLDAAATTLQKPANVARRMSSAIRNLGSPGRGGHKFAMDAGNTAFKCREKAAALFNVDDPENVAFTFNATHGLNIAINSLVRKNMRVVVSGYEHNSVIRPLKAIGANVDIAASDPFDSEKAVRAFENKLFKHTDVVVINHVSNVFGFVLPVEEIAAICRSEGIPFIIDASQSAGCIGIDMKQLGADFIAMPGHKGLYGPQGTGILLCKGDVQPFMYGGSGSESMSKDMPDFLPDRLEAGTHNMPGIAGLLAGLEFVSEKGPENILRHERNLIKKLADGLFDIDGVKVYFDRDASCYAGVLSFNIGDMSPETVGEMLAKRGIAVRAGLHCAPAAHSTVGTLPYGTVRASVSAFNRTQDIYALLNAVEDIKNK